MRSLIIAAALLTAASVSAPVFAQDAATAAASVAPAKGQTVWSADGKRIGSIDTVRKDKAGAAISVGIISDYKMIHIPISTLSAKDKGFATTLSLKEARSN